MSIFYQNRSERLLFFTSHNNSFTAHLHRQVELIVVLEGELCTSIDHTEYKLSPGCAAIIFPNQLHSLKTVSDSRILLCIFDADYCHSYCNFFFRHATHKAISFYLLRLPPMEKLPSTDCCFSRKPVKKEALFQSIFSHLRRVT